MARKTVRRERKDRKAKAEKAVVKSTAAQGAGGPDTKLIEASPARTPNRKQSTLPDLSWQAKGISPGSDVSKHKIYSVGPFSTRPDLAIREIRLAS